MSVTFRTAEELAQALRRAAEAHGAHEARTGREDADWPTWYAEHMVREQRFAHLPERVETSRTTTAQETVPARGADGEHDFFLRYGTGGDDLSDG
ncbi:hypothetical protein V5P93_004099 [Actinokineospora auranticolor]|uniref:Uncharacterized protein n=1 Tax=Actinokineospora auranticolor TaxID=155976 RepID=A0A2S6GD59_9PSEU|nr:hypothetical protein [Actinokineospora auranticolor]PPK63163.1 hypothetical protein CLV40_13132 [Actinokineospora auranticolor]